MKFESLVIAFSDRFLAQRTFELVVAPALADLEFEDAAGRRSRVVNRMAVIRATAGAMQEDMRSGVADFVKLFLLSYCYFIFPIALGIRIFKTWADFGIAAVFVLVMSLVPVMVCFWPTRHSVRPD